MPFDFSGKRALVTGAGRGIGRDLAKALAAAGASVYALSATKKNLDSLKEEIPSIHVIHVDLNDWKATRTVAETVGHIDFLVNNAAYSPEWCPFVDTTRENIQGVLDVNVMAAVNLSQVFGKKMIEKGKGGAIVNVSSINGVRAMPGCVGYNLSKAALDMLTKQMALELGPYNIRTNSVNPTVVMTDMGREHWGKPEKSEGLLIQIPMGRFAEVREVVETIMFLLSDHASMVNGVVLPVEGGQLCNIPVPFYKAYKE
ncbi:hypothetical protein CHS0354_019439 [Potamilus streckersoni]|uniref:L-xylulose reductase n=1 Tax=Potamilus streckersoni TaxID=2493646 RepID=A0AAE0SIL5_9BIVA|nr:hypothetical protein CHS0354_019439 [Potamilus streckersoni]